mgnify:CR=1 FL=1
MIVRCDKCGGNVEVARLSTPRGDVQLAGVFSLDISSIEARVCAECGYIELYATQPHQITAPAATAEPIVTSYEE